MMEYSFSRRTIHFHDELSRFLIKNMCGFCKFLEELLPKKFAGLFEFFFLCVCIFLYIKLYWMTENLPHLHLLLCTLTVSSILIFLLHSVAPFFQLFLNTCIYCWHVTKWNIGIGFFLLAAWVWQNTFLFSFELVAYPVFCHKSK